MMYKFKDFKNLVFSRRAFVLVTFKVLVLLALSIRLFFLQVLRSGSYKTLSERNRIKFFLLEPKRGEIKDIQGKVLAENKVNYQLYFYKQRNKKYAHVLHKLFAILSLEEKERQRIVKTVSKSGYLYPVMIQDSLNWDTVVKIESSSDELSGVYISKGYIRFYPMKEAFAHVIGYVGIPSKNEVEKYKLHHASGFRIGKTAIEKVRNRDLIGEFGLRKVEVNAYRSVVRELGQEPSAKGKSLKLTINNELQERAYNLSRNTGGSIVLMDIKSGNVLAMASKPAFDPNIFSMPISHRDWSQLISNKNHPFTNRSIGKLYPPGSVWKIITGLAILGASVSEHETVFCPGYIKVGNQTYKCWKKSGHGHMDLRNAIYNSCNVYFFKLCQEVGINNIHRMANILGFGQHTGIGLPGELSGINPSRQWKEKTYAKDWLIGDTVNTSIGQGYNLVTPVQLATMISRVSSGLNLSPNLYADSIPGEVEKLDIPERHLQIMRSSLKGVFSSPNGSGYNIRITEKKYSLAGKAGTAQVVSGDTSRTSNRQIKSHAIFTGYAPVHDPRYAVSVTVDHAGWGIRNAAPLGIDILYFAQTKL